MQFWNEYYYWRPKQIRHVKLFEWVKKAKMVAEYWFLKTDDEISGKIRQNLQGRNEYFLNNEEIREMKQGSFESFDIFYERMKMLVHRFMELKPTEADIHKDLLIKVASDECIMERDISRKRMLKIGTNWKKRSGYESSRRTILTPN